MSVKICCFNENECNFWSFSAICSSDEQGTCGWPNYSNQQKTRLMGQLNDQVWCVASMVFLVYLENRIVDWGSRMFNSVLCNAFKNVEKTETRKKSFAYVLSVSIKQYWSMNVQVFFWDWPPSNISEEEVKCRDMRIPWTKILLKLLQNISTVRSFSSSLNYFYIFFVREKISLRHWFQYMH